MHLQYAFTIYNKYAYLIQFTDLLTDSTILISMIIMKQFQQFWDRKNREKKKQREEERMGIKKCMYHVTNFYIHAIGIIIIFTAKLSFSDNVFIMVQTSCFVILSC